MAVYDTLNSKQQEAVFCTEGPLLVLAGAGSGKTRVLTHRVAYLIEEKGVSPWNIMAITFTNKAAGEMRERVDRLVEYEAQSVWVSTFHSSCVRILRRFIENLGYNSNFTIYDADDQKTLMKLVVKKLNLDAKQYREREMLSVISNAKNELIGPKEFMANAQGDWRQKKIAEIYQAYQDELKKNNALDFDDLIFKTVDLFRTNPDVLDYYQERFRYIMVDEYQDTNTAQFQLVSLLAGKYKNLCVVGDDDQSIYKFRGANIANILNFEASFPGAKVIKLEQNYRSTSHILNAANAVIRNNRGRKDKALWTANGEGCPVMFRQYDQAYEEADGIIRDILKDGRDYRNYAILYRTNAQSRLLEEKCIAHNVPYRLVGGVNFYQRREIKDILSYLKTIANGQDDLAVQRIINVPKRGIGSASIAKLMVWQSANGGSFYDACVRAADVPGMGKMAGKIQKFVRQMETFRAMIDGMEVSGDVQNEAGISEGEDIFGREGISEGEDVSGREEIFEGEGVSGKEGISEREGVSGREEIFEGEGVSGREQAADFGVGGCDIRTLIEAILEDTGYKEELLAEGEVEAKTRLENIDELMSKATDYSRNNEDPSLDGFLEEVALVADVDRMDDSENRVTLMTLHSAKGLEFPVVYLSGLEDGLFPSSMSIFSDDRTEIEEERRLCYVGITRAMERLVITSARLRMVKGETRYSKVSRFVEEIPEEWLDAKYPESGVGRAGGWAERARSLSGRDDGELPWSQEKKNPGISVFGSRSNSYASPTASFGQASARAGFGQVSHGGFASYGAGKTPGFGKAFAVKKSSSLDYAEGDRVCHIKFGEGTVQSIKDGVKDYEVTVDFDRVGVKKMFASFAKLQKVFP